MARPARGLTEALQVLGRERPFGICRAQLVERSPHDRRSNASRPRSNAPVPVSAIPRFSQPRAELNRVHRRAAVGGHVPTTISGHGSSSSRCLSAVRATAEQRLALVAGVSCRAVNARYFVRMLPWVALVGLVAVSVAAAAASVRATAPRPRPERTFGRGAGFVTTPVPGSSAVAYAAVVLKMATSSSRARPARRPGMARWSSLVTWQTVSSTGGSRHMACSSPGFRRRVLHISPRRLPRTEARASWSSPVDTGRARCS